MRYGVGCFLLLLTAAAGVRGELKPEEVGVIAMAADASSRLVAEHFIKARKIPPSQLLLLTGSVVAELSRETWETQTRPAIRRWLSEEGRRPKIRCLVTTMGVPLKIGRRSESEPTMAARREFLARAREERVVEADDMLRALDALGAGAAPVERPPLRPEVTSRDLFRAMEAALKAAQERVALLPPDKQKDASAAVERLYVTGGGLNALVRSISARDRTLLSNDARQRLEFLRGRLQGLQEGMQGLGAISDTVGRDAQIMALLHEAGGVIGALEWIDMERELLQHNETYSSFDSELSLILIDDYPLFRWQPNFLRYTYDILGSRRETMMVSRLAAPTVNLALALVDTAMSVEANGLSGKVYLDARGMDYNPQRDNRGSYGEYDQSLRELAERLQRHTTLSVVLDNRPELFPLHSCPDAALYCGWYSLGSYVDSFTWSRGAVGYHLASMEAETLTTPGSRVWCNAMLERGVCATLGPVYEPYLLAFPLPDDFFSLLLTGRFTLVETYYRTNPFNSWVMVLVGDPLYNPFKAHPQLTLEQIPERMKPKPSNEPAVPGMAPTAAAGGAVPAKP